MRRQFLLASASTIALTGSALAADLAPPRADRDALRERAPAPSQAQPQAQPQPQPQPQPQAANWSGGQLGGSNGVSSVNNNFVEPGAYICPADFPFGTHCFETPFSFSGHPWSYTIGPFLGYRWQWGMSVVGVEADWSWKKGETSNTSSIPQVCFGCTIQDTMTGSVKQDWDSSFRARYGYLVTPSTLVYVTGGLALGQINGAFSYHAIIVGGDSTATANTSWSDVRVGGTVGAGLETEIWAGWKARIEYRYTDFGSYTKTVHVSTSCGLESGCSFPSSSASIHLRESFHTVRFGLGFDFWSLM